MGLSPEEYRKTRANYPLEKRIAIVTDFDLTQTEVFQQEPIFTEYFDNIKKAYDGKIINGKKIEINKPLDWFRISDAWAEPNNGTAWVSQFLYNMNNGVFPKMSKKDLVEIWGPKIKLSPGVPEFVNNLREQFDGECYVGFYIASVGITDLILGTEAGKVADGVFASDLVSLKAIHNSENLEDQYTMPVDYVRDIVKPFGKTECVIKIAKGASEKLDDLVRNDDLLYSYNHLIYLGDGTSDVSAFAYLQKKGSTLVCVYEESNLAAYMRAKSNDKLTNRINALLPRDYQLSSPTYWLLAKMINSILSKQCRFPSQLLDLEKKRRLDPNCEEHKVILAEIRSHVLNCKECNGAYSYQHLAPK